MTDWLGVNSMVDGPPLVQLLVRFGFDLLVATAVIRGVYARLYHNREYVFTYYLFNAITFMMCYMLRKAALQTGVALALFGVFGILRYRTEQIRMRDLTYLFIVIGIGVLNGVADLGVSAAELLAVNIAIVLIIAMLQLGRWQQTERTTPMLYDRLELLAPGRQAEMAENIRTRTGLDVVRVEVNQMDLLRDAAEITIIHR